MLVANKGYDGRKVNMGGHEFRRQFYRSKRRESLRVWMCSLSRHSQVQDVGQQSRDSRLICQLIGLVANLTGWTCELQAGIDLAT